MFDTGLVFFAAFCASVPASAAWQGLPDLAGCRRGMLISAVVFGALHNDRRRNWQFSVWAGAVGVLYGAAFVATQDLYVPIGAHWLSNIASGAIWFRQRRQ